MSRTSSGARWAVASLASCALALGGTVVGASLPMAAAAPAGAAATSPPVAADAPWTATVTWLVGQLSASEKVDLIHGGGPTGGPSGPNALDPDEHGQAGYIKGVPRLGIPANRHVDALGINVSAETTAAPSRIGLASSFDRGLFDEFGELVGKEGVGTGMTLIYGPQADLARTPSWSRNNTAYSEDPYLASELAAEEINAIQGQGLMSQVKHVGMYNGQNQNTPSIVEGQAAHEIYLAPAERAADEGVSSMMCSYATFEIKDDSRYTQPDYACGNSVMMNEIIKNDWNFKGFITSDYNAIHATSNFLAGVDQEFATNYLNTANLLPLIDPTSASYDPAYAQRADEAVARTLYQDERFGLLDNDHIPAEYRSGVAQHGDVDTYDNTITIDKAAGIQTARQLAERAGVLLKNDGDVLPLSDSTSVNVVGQTSTLLPAAPGGEKSQGFGDRNAISPYKAMRGIGGATVVSNPGIDLLGTTVPAANLKQDSTTTAAGLTRTTTPAGGGTPTTSVDAVLDGRQTDLVRGNTYNWSGYIDVPADDTYQLQIQRPYGKDNGDDSKFNDGISRASGSTVSLSVDGTTRTLANPDSNILQNTIPSFATGTSNKVVADNGQYLGYDNTGTAVALTPGRHAISLTYTPAATVPATPTLRLAWSAKNTAVSQAVAAAATNDVSVIFADDSGSTGGDGASTTTDVKSLSAAQNSLITQTIAAAHAAGNKAVVVLNTGSAVQMPWVDDADGILEMWYPGQEGGTATANLLYGKANPSGHLTLSFPKSSQQSVFGVEDTNGNGSIGAGDAGWERSNPTQDADETVPTLKWTEGLSVGYRWFTDPSANTHDYDPLFAFGHGLSYTGYAYDGLRVKTSTDGGLDVTLTATNTGARAGRAVPQVYVGPSAALDPAAFEQTPLRLVEFDSVALDAGQSKTVSLHVAPRELSSYSTEDNNWVLGTGERTVYLGAASDNLVAQATANVVANATAPAVTTQPAAVSKVKKGTSVTLTAAATGNPEPTVRWQASTDGGSTWTDVPGETTTTFTYTANVDGTQHRAAFTNDLGTAYTYPNRLELITPVPPKMTTSATVKVVPSTVSHRKHATVKIKVTATTGTPTGTVVVHYGNRTKTVPLPASKHGTLTVRLPTLKVGRYKVWIAYSGNSRFKADVSDKVILRVT